MPSTAENRLKVRDAWTKGEMHHTTNFETVGGVVFSYDHVIGLTTTAGRRIAFDCHYSKITSTHCHVLFSAADEIRQCPKHPHASKMPGPVPHDSPRLIVPPDAEAQALRNGIEAALGTILVAWSGKVKNYGTFLLWIETGLKRVLEGKSYYE